jgi:hypothetical protein
MTDLVLRFAGGTVQGEGRDVIGAFTFAGNYDEAGRVVMVKQYIGAHRVLYTGTYDGEGTIHGRWSIGAIWTGPFALMMDREAATAAASGVAIRDLIATPGPPGEDGR